jgi:hypothetical protein
MVVVGIVGGLAAGCATHQSWRLVQPPEAADAAAPGGVRLFPRAPLDDWPIAGTYPSEEACAAARDAAWNENVERAHAEAGDDAKYDPAVRRAVHARCLPAPER